MAKPNQGYRRDLDLQETPNDFTALDNLGGTGTVSYTHLTLPTILLV